MANGSRIAVAAVKRPIGVACITSLTVIGSATFLFSPTVKVPTIIRVDSCSVVATVSGRRVAAIYHSVIPAAFIGRASPRFGMVATTAITATFIVVN